MEICLQELSIDYNVMLDDWYMKRARDGLSALYDALPGEERKQSW